MPSRRSSGTETASRRGYAQPSERTMNRMTVRSMALVASVAFAACGESTDLVMGELSEVEAQDLAGAVLLATFSSTGEVPVQPAASADGPQAVPFSFASEFDGDVACAMGGMVNVAASLEVSGDTDSEAGHIEYSMTQIHTDCMAESEAGVVFTLNGAPDMNLAFSVDNDGEGVVEWGGSVEGGLEWITDGRMGSCEVDLSFEGRQVGEDAVSGALSGMMCGFQIARSFSIG